MQLCNKRVCTNRTTTGSVVVSSDTFTLVGIAN